MDVTLSNPFLEAAVNVLQTMALTETHVGKPFLVGQAACPDAKDPQAPERTGGPRT
jgi:CheY-specific phosphatase CheX